MSPSTSLSAIAANLQPFIDFFVGCGLSELIKFGECSSLFLCSFDQRIGGISVLIDRSFSRQVRFDRKALVIWAKSVKKSYISGSAFETTPKLYRGCKGCDKKDKQVSANSVKSVYCGSRNAPYGLRYENRTIFSIAEESPSIYILTALAL
ncbi:hypothetical protein RND81_11G110300 [Saponaria officinalis]|uniref:Uncharacterized protein n=1 Tax=Saponaria officinalis TaxID=3572 RepID=A0AAW1HKP1_SAPOF